MDNDKQFSSMIQSITNSYGVEILNDGKRFCAIFSDIAPNMKKECKIMHRVKEEGIFPLLFEAYFAEKSKRTSIISKIEYILKTEAGFSDEWYQCLINGFAEAFSWTTNVENAYADTTERISILKKKYFTKNAARNFFSSSSNQIVLPENYNVVGKRAFEYFEWPVHVDSILIPNGYIEIQSYAFDRLIIDHYISIPDSVIEIDYNAFELGKTAYVICSPNSYAYRYCSEHYINNSVDGIPEKKEQIHLNMDEAKNVDSYISNDKLLDVEYRKLFIPKGTTSVGKGAFRNRTDFNIVLSDDDLKYIKKGAFSGCKSLRCVILGHSIQSIASEAFEGCSNLEIIFIDASDFQNEIRKTLGDDEIYLTISDNAFQNCSNLKYIVSHDFSKQLDNYCKTFQLLYLYYDNEEKNDWDKLPVDLHRMMLFARVHQKDLDNNPTITMI